MPALCLLYVCLISSTLGKSNVNSLYTWILWKSYEAINSTYSWRAPYSYSVKRLATEFTNISKPLLSMTKTICQHSVYFYKRTCLYFSLSIIPIVLWQRESYKPKWAQTHVLNTTVTLKIGHHLPPSHASFPQKVRKEKVNWSYNATLGISQKNILLTLVPLNKIHFHIQGEK